MNNFSKTIDIKVEFVSDMSARNNSYIFEDYKENEQKKTVLITKTVELTRDYESLKNELIFLKMAKDNLHHELEHTCNLIEEIEHTLNIIIEDSQSTQINKGILDRELLIEE